MRTKVKFNKGVALVYNEFISYYKNFKSQEINDGVNVDVENTVLSIAKDNKCKFVRINHKDIAHRVCELISLK